MMDSNIVNVLFTLLRSGLWDKPIDDLSCFPLTEEEWKTLYKIAVSQTVEGVIFDGVQQLPLTFLPPKALLLTWVVRVNKIENTNALMDNCINEQVSFFNKMDVNPILLKGQGIASYYPNSNHRVCGDIDWFFANKNESRSIESFLRNKIKVYRSTSESVNYVWRSCDVENHTKLFDVFNPFARYKLTKIEATFLKNKIKKHNYYVLPPNLNIIQVNLHILKHLLSFGIGLRQFCDSAILYASLEGEYDKKWLYNVYSDLGVLKWTHALHDLLVNYLGLSPSSLPFSMDERYSSKWMIADVLSTGNFGFYDNIFSQINSDKSIDRKNKSKKLWYSFQQYFHLAPYEAISFPIVHFTERFKYLTCG